MILVLAFKHSQPENDAWYWKLAAKVIKWGTRSNFFHVEIAVGDKWIGAHTERGIEIHPFDPIHDKTFDYYELVIEDLTESQMKKFWAFVTAQAGTGYDWKGIYLTQVLNLNWENKSKWFCSEIVAKMLQLLYVEEFINIKPNQASPQTIFDVAQKIGRKIDVD
jgi:hypothetical protein